MIDKTSLDNARSIDLITFLERYKGFHFRHFNGEYRPAEHTSLAVKSNRLSWYWHSKGIGGYGAIDFLMKIEGYDFKGAMSLLADEPTTAPVPPTADCQRAFFLPERAKSNRRAYAYLTITRGLDSKIIQELFQEKKIYEDTVSASDKMQKNTAQVSLCGIAYFPNKSLCEPVRAKVKTRTSFSTR